MADNKDAAKKPEETKAKALADKQEQQAAANDPAFAKYHGLFVQGRDKKVLENSMLISLVFFFIVLYITFPEFAGKILNAEQKDDVIEIPKQTIVKQEQKQEQKQEVQKRVEKRERDFNQIPDLSRPTGDEAIVEDVKIDRLDVQIEDVDDMMFGDLPDSSPGPVEVAGDVVPPEVSFSGTQPFPQKAKILRRSGQVKVRLIIRKDGSYEVLRVEREDPPGFGFGDAMLQYLKQSSWKPATQNGRPIDVYFDLTVNFSLKS